MFFGKQFFLMTNMYQNHEKYLTEMQIALPYLCT